MNVRALDGAFFIRSVTHVPYILWVQLKLKQYIRLKLVPGHRQDLLIFKIILVGEYQTVIIVIFVLPTTRIFFSVEIMRFQSAFVLL